MFKKAKIIGIASVASVALLYGCSEEKVEKEEPKVQTEEKNKINTEEVEKSKVNVEEKVGINSKIISDIDEGNYMLKIKIPVIENLENKEIQEKLNKEIEENAIKEKERIEGRKNEVITGEFAGVYGLVMDFENIYTNNNIINISYDISEFSGGAIGISGKDALVYDIEKNKKINLSEILKSDDDLNTLTEVAKKSFKETYGDQLMNPETFEEEFEKIKGDQIFYMNDKSIFLVFSPYQYTPGSMGSPVVEIPKNSIDFLNDEYK